VVVTSLLPDDPKPGEVWEWYKDGAWVEVTILAPPLVRPNGYDVVPVGYTDGRTEDAKFASPRFLRPKPVLKTYRLTGERPIYPCYEIQAESKEAAIKLLAEAIEEIT
jgi:hypothetical protein